MSQFQIREQVLATVKGTKGYWMILKNTRFGIAGYVKSLNQKYYLEILFTGEPENPFLLFAPNLSHYFLNLIYSLATQQNLSNPPDVFALAQRILEKMSMQKNEEIKKELDVLKEFYNCHQKGDNLFDQHVHIETSEGTFEFFVNFDKYPSPPKLEIDADLLKKLQLQKAQDLGYFSDWDETNPKPLLSLFNELEDRIRDQAHVPIPRGSQILDFEKVKVRGDSPEINCHLVRGQAMGLFTEDTDLIEDLYQNLALGQQSLTGKIYFFGEDFSPDCAHYGVREIAKGRPPALNSKSLASAASYSLRCPKSVKNRKKYLKSLLALVHLENFAEKKVKSLSDFEVWRVHLLRALYEDPSLLLVSMPREMITRLEIQQARDILNEVKSARNCVLIVAGPQEIIANCDKVITLQKLKSSEAHDYQKLIEETFKSRKVISLLLRRPDESVVAKLNQIPGVTLKEERKGEKFRLYAQKNTDDFIQEIFQAAGQEILSFEKLAPSLSDYLFLKRS